jgi:hypothetical protein
MTLKVWSYVGVDFCISVLEQLEERIAFIDHLPLARRERKRPGALPKIVMSERVARA